MSTDLPSSPPSRPSGGSVQPREPGPPGSTPDDPPEGKHGDLPDDVAALTYEQAREELVAVVSRLEAGSVPLEDSLALWERGEALARRCQAWLDHARARLAAVEQPDQPAQ